MENKKIFHNNRLRYLLILLIIISAAFTASALYTVSAIFTVARFNDAERRAGKLIIRAVKNLSSAVPAIFYESVRQFEEGYPFGKPDYGDFLKKVNDALSPLNISILIWLDEEGIPVYTAHTEGEPFSQVSDEIFFEIWKYRAFTNVERTAVYGFVRVKGETMLAASFPILPKGGGYTGYIPGGNLPDGIIGRIMALSPLPYDFKLPAERVLETELFYSDDPDVIADWNRLAGDEDGLISVVDRDTLQASAIFKDLNDRAIFAVYGFFPRQAGGAAIDILIFHTAAFFFALLVFTVLTNAVIYRMVQLPLEHFADAADRLAKDGVPVGRGYRGIFALLAEKVNLLGLNYHKRQESELSGD
ncbi:MAG: hypothetical protein LBD73_07340 [Deferribacteraceae bacterium]|jgi:hypothetical protein|nr:hypothetical protein [Deferribacteraceae bacterium]